MLAAPIERPARRLLDTGQASSSRRLRVRSGYRLRYHLVTPDSVRPDTPVLVSVHGISRNARAHAAALGPLAASRGALVVAPLFNASRFPDYQRLGHPGACPREALDQVLDDVTRLTGAGTRRLHLFGYSGGAQFAHRLALLHPERVRNLGLGAAGWYTLPDEDQPFPRGAGAVHLRPGDRVQLDAFLDLRIRLFVGDADSERDPQLNRSRSIERQQGATRLERAAAWLNSLRVAALSRNRRADAWIHVLSGGIHDFEQNVATAGLDHLVIESLLGDCV